MEEFALLLWVALKMAGNKVMEEMGIVLSLRQLGYGVKGRRPCSEALSLEGRPVICGGQAGLLHCL